MTLPGVLLLKSPVMKRAAMRCLLHAVDVFLQVRIPDDGTILQEGADEGSIDLLFTGWWAAFEVSS